jgi:hypothetical protein
LAKIAQKNQMLTLKGFANWNKLVYESKRTGVKVSSKGPSRVHPCPVLGAVSPFCQLLARNAFLKMLTLKGFAKCKKLVYESSKRTGLEVSSLQWNFSHPLWATFWRESPAFSERKSNVDAQGLRKLQQTGLPKQQAHGPQ